MPGEEPGEQEGEGRRARAEGLADAIVGLWLAPVSARAAAPGRPRE
ncbi:hypothetical protein ABZ595_26355 [Streptomyces rubradiris]